MRMPSPAQRAPREQAVGSECTGYSRVRTDVSSGIAGIIWWLGASGAAGWRKIRDGPMAPWAGVAPISRRWAGVTLLTSATAGGFGGVVGQILRSFALRRGGFLSGGSGSGCFRAGSGGGRGGTGCCRSSRVFRFGRGRCFGFLRLRRGNGLVYGFVREFGAESFEAVEIFDGAAVETLGLGLIAEENGPGW